MDDSYIKLPRQTAKKLAQQTLDECAREETEALAASIDWHIKRHQNLWWWLPGYKPLSKEKAKYKAVISGCYSRAGDWNAERRSKSILVLCDACGPLEDIFISSTDMYHIQAGTRLAAKRLAND